MSGKQSVWMAVAVLVSVTSLFFSMGCAKLKVLAYGQEGAPVENAGAIVKSPARVTKAPNAAAKAPDFTTKTPLPSVRVTPAEEEDPADLPAVPVVETPKPASQPEAVVAPAVVAPPVAAPVAPVENLAVANMAFGPNDLLTPDMVAPSKPVIFSNSQVVDADTYIGSLSGDIKALREMVQNVSTVMASKTDVVVRIVEKPVDRVVEKSMSTETMIKKLDQKLVEDISAQRSGLKPYLAKASLCLLNGDCLLLEEDLAKLSAEDRLVVEDYRVLFTQLGERLGQGDREADRAALISSATLLSEMLDARKSVSVARAVLCSQIGGFGKFIPFTNNEFRPSAAPRILVYTELANFKSILQADGQHAVKLVQELILSRAGSGEVGQIWVEQPALVSDLSRTPRRDFFLVQLLRIPENLEPGDYTLTVKVSDLADGTSAVSVVPLRILGKK
jgi:hypothetical protein